MQITDRLIGIGISSILYTLKKLRRRLESMPTRPSFFDCVSIPAAISLHLAANVLFTTTAHSK